MKLCYLCPEIITELDELDRRVERLADLGYQGIELPACHPLPIPMEELEAHTRRVQLPIIALTSAWSYRHEGLSLVARDDVLRGRAVGRLIEYARLAARLGAVLIVGLIRGAPGEEPDARAALDRIEDGLARLARAAEGYGTRVAVEPINHLCVSQLHTPDEVLTTLARIGSPALGLALDTLHLHIETPSVPDALRAHARQAWTIHLADSHAGRSAPARSICSPAATRSTPPATTATSRSRSTATPTGTRPRPGPSHDSANRDGSRPDPPPASCRPSKAWLRTPPLDFRIE
jgi:sugar phosphate isomerase/epimerase